MAKQSATILAGIVAYFCTESSAYAYLDPGSGSMLLQLLLGGVAGIIVILKLYWQRLLTFFGLRKEEAPNEDAAPTLSTDEDKVADSPEQHSQSS